MAESPVADELRLILHEPGGVVVHVWKNIVICTWHGDATVEIMRTLGVVFEGLAREVGRVSVVSFIPTVQPMPDEAMRAAYREFVVAHSAKFAHLAFVLQRQGFIGSMIRGIITSLLMAVRGPFSMQIMSSSQDVVEWLPARHAATTGVELPVDELAQVLQRACAAAD